MRERPELRAVYERGEADRERRDFDFDALTGLSREERDVYMLARTKDELAGVPAPTWLELSFEVAAMAAMAAMAGVDPTDSSLDRASWTALAIALTAAGLAARRPAVQRQARSRGYLREELPLPSGVVMRAFTLQVIAELANRARIRRRHGRWPRDARGVGAAAVVVRGITSRRSWRSAHAVRRPN